MYTAPQCGTRPTQVVKKTLEKVSGGGLGWVLAWLRFKEKGKTNRGEGMQKKNESSRADRLEEKHKCSEWLPPSHSLQRVARGGGIKLCMDLLEADGGKITGGGYEEVSLSKSAPVVSNGKSATSEGKKGRKLATGEELT